MNVLVIATKSPWPPVDGGRFLLLNTLQALAASGCRLTLVAPVDPTRFDLGRAARELAPLCTPRLVPAAPRPPAVSLLGSLRSGGAPLSIARHSLPAVRQEVERLLGKDRFDLVHAEQLQALPQAEPAFARRIPIVLRAQNVESDLWAAAALRGRGIRGLLLRREARLLAGWEGNAVRRAAATLALTEEDAARLRELSGGGGRVGIVRAAFPDLPPGTGRLEGEPAVVVFGSRGWLPNEESAAWFAGEVWPAVRAELPGAVLHLFGSDLGMAGPDVISHPSPSDSGEVYAPGSILAVPLRIASGVRIKILEAWARGVPVVATPAALAGLEARDGEEALVAREPRDFASAIARLHREPALAASLVNAGREARRERHDPRAIARRMMEEYEKLI
ncbi:MAG TPA: glycosyltransferase family 4 protein [Thermoanaerobaculia bacterium]|nr:glycosyltransferase family 4 protein [Thermoanaerobaculia bacterium]